jgi:apolipoprotein D and lipocalin family protein
MPFKTIVVTTFLAFTCLASVQAQDASDSQPKAVAQIDVNQYMGKWYEIARIPMSFQKKCVSDVSAEYSLNDDETIKVVNSCRNKDGVMESTEALAWSVNPGNSQLKVNFLPKGLRWIPFTDGDYWVLRIDQDYQTVLVGGPSNEYLWLLSRSPKIDEATYASYLETASQQGFDVSTIIKTEQNTQ